MTLLLNGFDGFVVLNEDLVIGELAETIVHVLRLDLMILFIKNAHDSSFYLITNMPSITEFGIDVMASGSVTTLPMSFSHSSLLSSII